MPDPVEGLGDVEKYSSAILLVFQAGGDCVDYSMNLMGGRVVCAEAKLMGR